MSSYFSSEKDTLPHKLKLVKEVSLELSLREGEDETVVMWVLESFGTLVAYALNAKESKFSTSTEDYSGVITTVFDLNTSIVPIAVSSSATTVDSIRKSKSHILSFFKFFS